MTIEWDGGHVEIPASLIWLALLAYLLGAFLRPIVEGVARGLVAGIKARRARRRR